MQPLASAGPTPFLLSPPDNSSYLMAGADPSPSPLRSPSPHFLKLQRLVQATGQALLPTEQPLSRWVEHWVKRIKNGIDSAKSQLIDKKFSSLLKPIFARRGLDFKKMVEEDSQLNSETAQQIEEELNSQPLIIRLAEKVEEIRSDEESTERSAVQKMLDKAFKGKDQSGRAYTNLHFNEFDLFMPHIHSLEILSLCFAYQVQEQIEIPIQTDSGFVLIPYKLERIPIVGGFEAYGLVPTSNDLQHPAILLYPGTTFNYQDTGLLARIMADIDPTGPGFTFFNMAYGNIEDWLKRNTDLEKNRKVITCGYSLGGALAAYTAAYLGQYLRESYTFASPAFSPFAANRWQENSEKPLLINFCNANDFIPTWGYERFGHDVVIHLDDEQINSTAFGGHHLYTVLDKESLLVKTDVEILLPRWMQVALQVAVFILLSPIWLLVVAWWLVFGHANSEGFTYLLYPVNVVIDDCYKNLSFLWYRAFPPQSVIDLS
jgi:pimeloyl-ACP methyl ester carboxylesterase